MRVIVVDDQAAFREVARECLMARGYEVVAEAGCAATAMEAVERYQPDAMLLDVRLGEDDGFAVCDAVTRTRPDLAVLASTEKDYDQDPERIESCGARGFVRKEYPHRVDWTRLWEPAASRREVLSDAER